LTNLPEFWLLYWLFCICLYCIYIYCYCCYYY